MQVATRSDLLGMFKGKSVAIIGSGPGCLDNEPGLVDSFDVVVRVNNHRTGPAQGFRTDVHYSFYGGSIKKTARELKAEGVRLIMCKCPNAKVLDSEWHRKNKKLHGTDFRYIYERRKAWWFAPVYVPPVEEFMAVFNLLQKHMPSTGFSAILAVLDCEPSQILISGYDFFTSKIHNVNEKWTANNPDDPIRHIPELELAWVKANASRFTVDRRLSSLLKIREVA